MSTTSVVMGVRPTVSVPPTQSRQLITMAIDIDNVHDLPAYAIAAASMIATASVPSPPFPSYISNKLAVIEGRAEPSNFK